MVEYTDVQSSSARRGIDRCSQQAMRILSFLCALTDGRKIFALPNCNAPVDSGHTRSRSFLNTAALFFMPTIDTSLDANTQTRPGTEQSASGCAVQKPIEKSDLVQRANSRRSEVVRLLGPVRRMSATEVRNAQMNVSLVLRWRIAADDDGHAQKACD
jgi:hypothetical protein